MSENYYLKNLNMNNINNISSSNYTSICNKPYSNLIFMDVHNNQILEIFLPEMPKLDSLVAGYNKLSNISNLKK